MICSNSMYLIFQPFLLGWKANPAFFRWSCLSTAVFIPQGTAFRISVCDNQLHSQVFILRLLPLKSVCDDPNYLLFSLLSSSVCSSSLVASHLVAIPSQSPRHTQVIIDPSLMESHEPFHAAQHPHSDILDSVLDHGLWCTKSCWSSKSCRACLCLVVPASSKTLTVSHMIFPFVH